MNTKRVIQYFATIAVTGDKKKEQQPGKMQVSSFLHPGLLGGRHMYAELCAQQRCTAQGLAPAVLMGSTYWTQALAPAPSAAAQ